MAHPSATGGVTSPRKYEGAGLVLLALAAWAGVHLAFCRLFLFHDSWKHIFPLSYRIMQQADGFRLPLWLGGVDSGSPLMIYTLSLSLFNPVRLATLAAGSWLRWDVASAMYLQKLSILATYLIFCGGTYVLGRVLFRHRLAAVYLFVAALFAGLCLETLHSDQTISILFWMPWAAAAGVRFHRLRDTAYGARYLCLAVLLVCLGMLDQHPLLVALPAAVAAAGYVVLWPRECRRFLGTHGWRLWPALVVVAVMLADLRLFQHAIADYNPSLRTELKVDPKGMGETGFVQPPCFPGTVLPLSFLTAHEQLSRNTETLFGRPFVVFRMNSLVLNIGLVPLLLALVFLLRPGMRKPRLLLTGGILVVLLVALQWSHLYVPLSSLPGFDSFRSYFLLIHPVAFGVLVMSGYGLDALLTLSPAQQRRLLGRALLLGVAVVAAGVAGMVWLLKPEAPAELLRRLAPAAAIDLAAALGCGLALLRSVRARDALTQLRWVVVPLVLAQATSFVGAYRIVGTDRGEVMRRYGIDRAAEAELPAHLPRVVPQCRRAASPGFAWSYLSRRDSFSFHRDLEGTFLRSRCDALYQEGLDAAPLLALSGVGHPVFWLSASAAPYDRPADLVAALNAHKETIAAHLDEVVYVPREQMAKLGEVGTPSPADGSPGAVRGVRVGRDTYVVRYHADRPAILVGAVTFDGGWGARVNGRPVPVARGNFNGLAVPVPVGDGTLELRYVSWPSRLYFASRYGLLLAVLGAGLVLLGRAAAKARTAEAAPVTAKAA